MLVKISVELEILIMTSSKILKNKGAKTSDRNELLEIEVKNFGPISKGKISLKPLTIFIGPNNSGKSYMAMLVHSILEAILSNFLIALFKDHILGVRYILTHRLMREIVKDFIKDEDFIQKLTELIKTLKDEEIKELNLLAEFIKNKCFSFFKEVFKRELEDELIRAFACPLDQLVKRGKRLFSIKIIMNSHYLSLKLVNKKLVVSDHSTLSSLNLRIKVRKTQKTPLYKISQKDSETLLIEIGERVIFNKVFLRKLLENLLVMFLEIFLKKFIGKNLLEKSRSYYLPAARSGILQSHKVLLTSILRRLPYVGIEKFEIPKLPGITSDFISSIIELPREKGPFYKLAKELEEKMLKGKIAVKSMKEYPHLIEIKYVFKDTEIPLYRASSAVSELAPLFLNLKYILGKNGVLIIEEPEAHLHPANQRILARYIVKLVRRGIHVIITTHSEYLLEQFNNFLLLSKISSEDRVKRYGYDEEDFLDINDIAVYVFDYDEKTDGYKIHRVKVSEETGIPSDEFLKIHEALYEEAIKLQRDIATKERRSTG